MKKFKNSQLSTDSRKLQTLALKLPTSPYQISLHSLLYAGLTLGRTRKVIPSPWYNEPGGGVGVDGSSPYFDFPFSGKPLTLILYKMKYILCVLALLKVCDVTKHGNHLAFFQELEIT